MRLAHSALSWSISSARTHELNRITFTYYATSIPCYDLRVVLRVPGEPTFCVVVVNVLWSQKRVYFVVFGSKRL
jgi:hypothetical protein